MPEPILTPAAAALCQHLHGRLRERWAALPAASASQTPPNYHAAPVPADLVSRRAELIVEASDLTALRSALQSDADAVVIDFDDTFSPTPANVQAAYEALTWAVQTDKPLLARTRALYALEPHLDFAGPAIAALCDLAAVLTARPAKPIHLYIPKLETVAEAHFWEDALSMSEAFLNLPRHTVRVCLQIETFAGLLNADALLYALRGRAYGLNAGRWDYVFSLTKHLGPTLTQPMPPRPFLSMDVAAMHAYAETLVQICRARNAEAIGGTAAVAPDPQNPQPALDAVLADKQREAAQGFTSAWVGLPELLGAVRAGLNSPSSPSLAKPSSLTNLPFPDILPLTEVQDSISLALDVFAAWFAGRGVIVRKGRIEDTATAELARALVWQWVRVGAWLDDGSTLTPERYRQERRQLMPDSEQAAQLLDHLVLAEECPAYFPQEAMRLIDFLQKSAESVKTSKR